MAIDTLATIEDYKTLAPNGQRTELVRGRIVSMNVPTPWHGYICGTIARLLGNYVVEHDLGRVVTNDAGVITERDPDTMRGADVCYYSYTRLPRGPLPRGYVDAVPELVFEVLLPGDRSSEVLAKVSEYLRAGVLVVCVVDGASGSVTVYEDEQPPRIVDRTEALALPDLLPGFQLPVSGILE